MLLSGRRKTFFVVETIKKILKEWSGEDESFPGGKLDILINIAAQTLTNPVSVERVAILNEVELQKLLGKASFVVENGYEATIRGGYQMLGGLIEANGGLEYKMNQGKFVTEVSDSSHSHQTPHQNHPGYKPSPKSPMKTSYQLPA